MAPAEPAREARVSPPSMGRIERQVGPLDQGRPEPPMSLARSAAAVLGQHVTFELESIDRLYMSLYVPILQRPEGEAHFCLHHRGHRMASPGCLTPVTTAFLTPTERFARDLGV